MNLRRSATGGFIALLLLLLGCRSAPSGSTSFSTDPPGQIPRFGHVFMVTLENHSYSQVIGNPAMPYLNAMAKLYSSLGSYYANFHQSGPNYYVWTTGECMTEYHSVLPPGVNNVVRALKTAGKTWKAYFDEPGTYVEIFQWFSDVAGNPAELSKIVPTSQLATDLANQTFADYSMIVPALADSAHDCPDGSLHNCPDAVRLKNADDWLVANIAPIVSSESFIANNDLMILLFDEGDFPDTECGGPTVVPTCPGATACGGHTVAVLIGKSVKRGYESSRLYHDESILRLTMEGLGVAIGNIPGYGATAPSMQEHFLPAK